MTAVVFIKLICQDWRKMCVGQKR